MSWKFVDKLREFEKITFKGKSSIIEFEITNYGKPRISIKYWASLSAQIKIKYSNLIIAIKLTLKSLKNSLTIFPILQALIHNEATAVNETKANKNVKTTKIKGWKAFLLRNLAIKTKQFNKVVRQRYSLQEKLNINFKKINFLIQLKNLQYLITKNHKTGVIKIKIIALVEKCHRLNTRNKKLTNITRKQSVKMWKKYVEWIIYKS